MPGVLHIFTLEFQEQRMTGVFAAICLCCDVQAAVCVRMHAYVVLNQSERAPWAPLAALLQGQAAAAGIKGAGGAVAAAAAAAATTPAALLTFPRRLSDTCLWRCWLPRMQWPPYKTVQALLLTSCDVCYLYVCISRIYALFTLHSESWSSPRHCQLHSLQIIRSLGGSEVNIQDASSSLILHFSVGPEIASPCLIGHRDGAAGTEGTFH